MTIISVLPPQILNQFNPTLLKDNDRFLYLAKKLDGLKKSAKYKENSRKDKEFKKLIELCEVLIEWNKKKKANPQAKNKKENEGTYLEITGRNNFRGKFRNVLEEFYVCANNSA